VVRAEQRDGAASTASSSIVLRRSTANAVCSGALWGLLYGVFVASTAWSYSSIYKTPASRAALAAAFESNRATIALFGPAPRLDTVAGFTVLKVFLTLNLLGAVWGLLAATRRLRGEEDAGRLELLLSGATTRAGATVQALAGLGCGVVALIVVDAVVIAVAGRSATVGFPLGASSFFAVALGACPLMFAAIGALTSQLAATRRQAASWAGLVLALSYVLRMLADASDSLHWLLWCSPLGWVEATSPLTSPDPWPLVAAVALAGGTGALSVALAARRDLGAALLARRRSRSRRRRGPTSQLALSARVVRPTSLTWLGVVGAMGLLVGFVAKSASSTLTRSSVSEILRRLGSPGAGLRTYLGAVFLETAVLLCFAAAAHVALVRSEELEGRLEGLLVRSTTRRAWLLGRAGLALAALVACGLIGGLAIWLGGASQSADLSPVVGIAAGLNTVAPAAFVLGLGIAAFGVAPRHASLVVYGYVAWSLGVEVLGGIGALNHVVADSSILHHLRAYPATSIDVSADLAMVGLGLVAALLGLAAFERRDLWSA
jgi:ABC-2 type transport system permease protein